MNWNQYRNSGLNNLKVIDLGTRHPKNNWWNGFFRDTEMETLIVCENGEAIKIKGLCIVEQVIEWPHYSEADHCWLVTVNYKDMDQSDGRFSINGQCEVGFIDYAEAGKVKAGTMFYKNERRH